MAVELLVFWCGGDSKENVGFGDGVLSALNEELFAVFGVGVETEETLFFVWRIPSDACCLADKGGFVS